MALVLLLISLALAEEPPATTNPPAPTNPPAAAPAPAPAMASPPAAATGGPELERLQKRVALLEEQLDVREAAGAPAFAFALHGSGGARAGLDGGAPFTFQLAEIAVAGSATLKERYTLALGIGVDVEAAELFRLNEFRVTAAIDPRLKISAGQLYSPASHLGETRLHGSYLHVGVDLPAAVDEATLPLHLVGLQADGTFTLGQVGLRYDLTVSNGRPSTFLGDSGDADFDWGKAWLLGAWLLAPGNIGVGVTGYVDTLPLTEGGLSKWTRESILTASAWGDLGPLGLTAEAYVVNHAAEQERPVTSISAFLEAEVGIGQVSPYLRAERAQRDGDSLYFAESDTALDLTGGAAGVRWDFATMAAAKAEGRFALLDGDPTGGFYLALDAGF